MQTGTHWRELYLRKLRRCGTRQTLQQFRWQHQNDAVSQLDHKTRLTRIVMRLGSARLRRQLCFPGLSCSVIRMRFFQRLMRR